MFLLSPPLPPLKKQEEEKKDEGLNYCLIIDFSASKHYFWLETGI